LPSGVTSFAETQAAWRFYNNPRIELAELIEPLRNYARQQLAHAPGEFVLLVHDWCKLSFPEHASKRDQAQLTAGDNRGYEISSVLAVDGMTGTPLAPVEMHLRTAEGMLSTRSVPPAVTPHADQVLPTMEASRQWQLGRPAVHVIDREGDSIGHFRAWDAAGHWFLVRGLEQRLVTWKEKLLSRRAVRDRLRRQRAFHCCGEALYQGRPAQLWVAETQVLLTRPARTKKGKKRRTIPGRALPLRMVCAEVRTAEGKAAATWYLLSNAPEELSGEQLARCYYWRWRIESFFKLLKSHAQQIEHWQQETGTAIARRLLVAAMACTTVWHLEQDDSPQAMQLKDTLVRFSGRQTKRSRPHTAPALLAGLWPLLTMLAYLEHHNLNELKQLLRSTRLPIDLHDS
jgi:hypothetical protein